MTDLRLAATSTNPVTRRRVGLYAALRLANHHLLITNHKSRDTSYESPVTNHAFLIDTEAIRNVPNPFQSNADSVSNRHRSGPSSASSFSRLTPRPTPLAEFARFGAINGGEEFPP